MVTNINCIHNDRAWCKEKRIKRSLWGLGARCCVEYQTFGKKCKFKVKAFSPNTSPPPVSDTPNRRPGGHVLGPPRKSCPSCYCISCGGSGYIDT
jgi:hypothetical protein